MRCATTLHGIETTCRAESNGDSLDLIFYDTGGSPFRLTVFPDRRDQAHTLALKLIQQLQRVTKPKEEPNGKG